MDTSSTNSLSIFTSSECLRKQLPHPSSSSVIRSHATTPLLFHLPPFSYFTLRAFAFHVRKYVACNTTWTDKVASLFRVPDFFHLSYLAYACTYANVHVITHTRPPHPKHTKQALQVHQQASQQPQSEVVPRAA